MAWCRQATSHYLSKCWPRSLSPNGVTMPQWVKVIVTYIDETRTWWSLRLQIRSWWRHQMGTFSALLALCAGNSPVTGEFSSQRPMTQSFDVFFNLCLSKRLSKQWRRRWFETPPCLSWRHCNVDHIHAYKVGMILKNIIPSILILLNDISLTLRTFQNDRRNLTRPFGAPIVNSRDTYTSSNKAIFGSDDGLSI